MLIDGTGEANVVSKVSGQEVESDCTVRMSIDTFGKLQRKEIKPFMAVASGKIKVKGDMSIAAQAEEAHLSLANPSIRIRQPVRAQGRQPCWGRSCAAAG